MRRLIVIIAVCVMALTFFPAGSAFAQEQNGLPDPGITPDSPLYFFDKLAEQVSLRLTFSNEERAQKALVYAEERLAEMNRMMNTNNVRATIQAVNGYNDRIDTAMGALESLGKQGVATQAMLAMRMANHAAIFSDIESGNGIPEEARKLMTQTREMVCTCQQIALGMVEQEDPDMAGQVRLMLMEQERNSLRIRAGTEEITDIEDSNYAASPMNPDENDLPGIKGQGNNGEGPLGGGEVGSGWGETSEGEGPDPQNQWGSDETDHGRDEPGDREGPDLHNQWGKGNK